jgi:addiction module HigA family antidote
MLEPIPPGEILLEEFLSPLGISQNQLARDVDIPVSRIAEIVKGRRAITADTALRLGAYFKTSAEFWLNLQTSFELRRLRTTSWPAVAKRIRVRDAA